MDTQFTPENPSVSGERNVPNAGDFAPQPSQESAVETSGEQVSHTPQQAPPIPPPASFPPAAAPMAQAPTSGQAAYQPQNYTPATASDVDVIEAEWVDKAEEVVKAHQGDPYGEEEAVETLQRDYLQKRYGHSVKGANSDSSPNGVS